MSTGSKTESGKQKVLRASASGRKRTYDDPNRIAPP